jgi:hypothetical protein
VNVSTDRWRFRVEQSHMLCRPTGAREGMGDRTWLAGAGGRRGLSGQGAPPCVLGPTGRPTRSSRRPLAP